MGTRTTPPTHSTATTTVVYLTGALASLVIVAPFLVSFHSLTEWANDRLGLDGAWTLLVPLGLDAVALAFIGLTYLAAAKGDAGGVSRAMVWVMVAGSTLANYRHGATISTDAAVFFAAMPSVVAIMLEVVIKRTQRTALAALDAVEAPLPRYRLARWLVAPRETFGAWRTGAREGITNPADALAAYRLARSTEPAPELAAFVAHGAESAELQAIADEPGGKERVLRIAFDAIGSTDTPADAAAWLAARGVRVAPTYAGKVATKLRAETSEPTSVPHLAALPSPDGSG